MSVSIQRVYIFAPFCTSGVVCKTFTICHIQQMLRGMQTTVFAQLQIGAICIVFPGNKISVMFPRIFSFSNAISFAKYKFFHCDQDILINPTLKEN